MKFDPIRFRRRHGGLLASSALVAAVSLSLPAFGQKIYFENFESIPLGPNMDEGLAGAQVWSGSGPTGWVLDDSGIPGITNGNDGVTEWAGWGFANKDWWVATAGNQRRAEWSFGQGTVMIADPDEWDDAGHEKGLYNAYAKTPVINIAGQAANSLVLAFDSSWRPEARDDGGNNFPVDENGVPINNQTAVIRAQFGNGAPVEILKWDSIAESPTYKADGEFINEAVLIPLNNPAGATALTLNFGMLESANDWWWAVDNVAVGVPPLVTGISATGVGFSVRISEALGKTVNETLPITATLEGANVAVTKSRDGERVTVTHDQSPKIYVPGKKYGVKVAFTTGAGLKVEDTAEFVAPRYTTVASTPVTLTSTIGETSYLSVDETMGVQVMLDGATVTPQSVRRVDLAAADGTDLPDQIVVSYTQSGVFASGSAHTVKLTYTTKTAQVVEETVSFKTPEYVTLASELGTATGTGADAGVRWKTHQLEAGRPANNIATVERQLRGELGASVHDTSGQLASGYFEVPYVNFEQAGTDAGNFKGSSEVAGQSVGDELIPGIPGTSGSTDNIAGEGLAYVEVPAAGLYTMVVNSDDGFQVSVGNATNPTYHVLGKFDAGRGAADTVFYFRADKAGVYLFRVLWFEGGGGASVEWFTVNADGTRALVNGTQTGSLKSFKRRTVSEPNLPAGGGVSKIALQGGNVVITYTGTLKSAGSINGPFAPVNGAASPYQAAPSEAMRFFIAE